MSGGRTFVGTLLSVCCLAGLMQPVGCGSKQKEAEVVSDKPKGQRAEDRSRCEYEGRTDRDVQES